MSTDRVLRKTSRSRWIIGVNIILFLLIGFGFGQEYLRNREIESDIARMKSENAALEAERLSSLSLIDTLSSSYFVESEARQSGLGKSDESLVIVQDSGVSSSVAGVVSHDDIPNPVRWFYYFFNQAQFEALQENV